MSEQTMVERVAQAQYAVIRERNPDMPAWEVLPPEDQDFVRLHVRAGFEAISFDIERLWAEAQAKYPPPYRGDCSDLEMFSANVRALFASPQGVQ